MISRTARLSLGWSFFFCGGNAGTSLGPLLAAYVLGNRQPRIAWFSLLALLAIILLMRIGLWVKRHHFDKPKSIGIHADRVAAVPRHHWKLPSKKIALSLAVLVALMFSKFFYLESMRSYFTFYLMAKFQLPVQQAQLLLFLFLFSVAAGTIIGGPIGDRFGRKYVIWISILGVAPLTLVLPYANLGWTIVLSVLIGIILSSAFPTTLVYAQELIPGKVGLISGFFFGFAFGMAGIGSAVFGQLADHTSIEYVYWICSFLPLIGLVTGFLPNLERFRTTATAVKA